MLSPISKWSETEVFVNVYVTIVMSVDTKNSKWSPDL